MVTYKSKTHIPTNKKKVHFIGIGGIGMSSLARYFKAHNWAVSGSDLASGGITKDLIKEGIKAQIGHKKAHISAGLGLVIYSQAIKLQNPELIQAKQLKIPLFSYPQVIGKLTRMYKTIAVAGAHGKSTTTAMVSLILMNSEIDPTVIIGTKLKEFGPPYGGKNFRFGHGFFLLLEADEFGKAFLNYFPLISIITNIDLEHLDTYKNLADIKNSFLKFLMNTNPYGTIILNKDSKQLFGLRKEIEKIANDKKLKIIWYSLNSVAAGRIKKIINVPGNHNVSNALAAYNVGKILKIPESKILKSIKKYHGVWRRMEFRGAYHVSLLRQGYGGQASIKYQVYDDYAHHPTEIKATLAAFREKFPGSKIICVFQPHQIKRLQILFKDFVNAFNGVDVLIVLPIYKVAGRESITHHVSSIKLSEKLADAVKRKHPRKEVFYLDNPKNIKKFLSKILNSKSYVLNPNVIVMMGAGDIVHYTRLLLS